MPDPSRSRPHPVTHPAGRLDLPRRRRRGRGLGWRLLPLALLALLAQSAGCVSLRPFAEVLAALPADQFLTVGDRRVHLIDTGPRDAPVVVLLHGFGASAVMWRHVQPRLAERYRVISIDLNGFGWSERPRRVAAYTLDGQTDLVVEVLDLLRIESASIVGHSYGGGIAQWLATRNPERVRSLVLVDAASPLYATTRRSRLAAVRPFAGVFLRSVALRPQYVRNTLEGSFYDDSQITDDKVALYLEPLRVAGTSFAYRALSMPLPGQLESFDPSVITQRTLVLWGENDELIPIATARKVAAALRDGHLVVLPETGHMPPEERPEETAREILAFLDQAAK